MISVRLVTVLSLGVILAGASIAGQGADLTRYRGFVLQGNLASVAKAGGIRATDAKTLHERPARIQQIEWRAPYVSASTALADPVRDVVFSFSDDQLFRIVVRYERDRMEGLTNDDVIESLVGIYGVPVLSSARTNGNVSIDVDAPRDTTVVARWEDPSASVTLFRGTYLPEFQLVLISKALNSRAGNARDEAVRLDTQEAPQREIDQRNKDAANALAAKEKARAVNKAAFRP
jgi:hypothetical protein